MSEWISTNILILQSFAKLEQIFYKESMRENTADASIDRLFALK
jgi:hypothetical protein